MEIKAHHCVCGSDRDRLASVTKKQNTKIAELESELSNVKNKLMSLITIKGQKSVSIQSVFELFGIEPPTESEIRDYIEECKRVEGEKLSSCKMNSLVKSSDKNNDYLLELNKKKYEEATTYRAKRVHGAMIPGWCPSVLIKEMYFQESF